MRMAPRTLSTNCAMHAISRRSDPEPQEVPSQARHHGVEGDQTIPAHHRPAALEAPLCPSGASLSSAKALALCGKMVVLTVVNAGPRDRGQPSPGRRGSPLAVPSNPSLTGSCRGLFGSPVRRYQSMRHSRKARHHHAKRHSVGEKNSRGLGRLGLSEARMRIMHIGSFGTWLLLA